MAKLTSKLKDMIRFVFYGIFYSPGTLYCYLVSFLTDTSLPKINWLSSSELINAIEKGRSIIRFGDGEVMLMVGRDIHFQKSSPSLSLELKELIENYNKDSKYLLCLPTEALTKDQVELKKNNRLRLWRLFRAFFISRTRTSLSYGDAHAFYRKDVLNDLTPLLKNRHVISVSHKNTIDNDFKEVMKKRSGAADFVTAPSKNAYQNKEEIIANINEVLEQEIGYKPIILFASGPTSKILTKYYTDQNIQAIDIGHGMEILTKDKDYSNRI